jgi:tRNA (guanine9-N1)-methyltransferase
MSSHDNNQINETIPNKSNDKLETEQETPKLSKNQLKRLKRQETALKLKAERRKRERELRKQKRINGLAVMEKPDGQIVEIKRKTLKKNLMSNSSNKLRIVLDCSFDHLMNSNDINHLGKQLNYCYAINRRMINPIQLYLTSFTNKVLLEKLVCANWDVHLSEKYFLDLFESELKENIVYLTSDSSNEISTFDENKIYIIGGLVDHNHHKSLCYNLAVEKNLQHARLPINKYMSMKTRQVLTVNQVYQIIAKFVECNDWKQAFISTLPLRKGAETIDDDSDENNLVNNKNNVINKEKEENCANEEETENNLSSKKLKLEGNYKINCI